MTPLIVIGAIIGLIALTAVLLPFFIGTGGLLQDAAAADSPAILQLRRTAILNRWLAEEKQHGAGMLTDREWSLRQVYLSSRYVDVTRRMDWLAASSQKETTVKGASS